MRKRTVLWGLGGTTRDFLDKKGFHRDLDIIAFTDNNPSLWNTVYRGIPVIPPSELKNMGYDAIIICSLYHKEIRNQLEQDLGVDADLVVSCFEMEEEIKRALIKKYSPSPDREIQQVVDYFRHNPLNVFGSYESKKQRYPVSRDDGNHPYILFEGKRMYFPDTFSFGETGGVQYVDDILYEQREGSPHLYIRSEDDIRGGSVIVDAGTCEGNFALRYIEKAKKVYLIEPDPLWMQALQRTFQPYRNKVVFCSKFVGKQDSADTITIDSLVSERADFIKMDIEGAELDALAGAKRTLEDSHAKCAICSYHRWHDEKAIRKMLEGYGYTTSTSQGYMFFPYDENIMDTLDLRRGVVYGDKDEEAE